MADKINRFMPAPGAIDPSTNLGLDNSEEGDTGEMSIGNGKEIIFCFKHRSQFYFNLLWLSDKQLKIQIKMTDVNSLMQLGG